MSNDDRDNPDFGDFDLSDDMFEPGEEATEPAETFPDPLGELGDPDATQAFGSQAPDELAPGDAATEAFPDPVAGDLGEGAEEPEEQEEEDAKGKKKKKKAKAKKEKKPKPKKEKKPKAKKEKKQREGGPGGGIFNASPYTVMLAISLVAVMLACLWLFMELKAYKLDIKAEDAKQRTSVVDPSPSAWPASRLERMA